MRTLSEVAERLKEIGKELELIQFEITDSVLSNNVKAAGTECLYTAAIIEMERDELLTDFLKQLS